MSNIFPSHPFPQAADSTTDVDSASHASTALSRGALARNIQHDNWCTSQYGQIEMSEEVKCKCSGFVRFFTGEFPDWFGHIIASTLHHDVEHFCTGQFPDFGLSILSKLPGNPFGKVDYGPLHAQFCREDFAACKRVCDGYGKGGQKFFSLDESIPPICMQYPGSSEKPNAIWNGFDGTLEPQAARAEIYRSHCDGLSNWECCSDVVRGWGFYFAVSRDCDQALWNTFPPPAPPPPPVQWCQNPDGCGWHVCASFLGEYPTLYERPCIPEDRYAADRYDYRQCWSRATLYVPSRVCARYDYSPECNHCAGYYYRLQAEELPSARQQLLGNLLPAGVAAALAFAAVGFRLLRPHRPAPTAQLV